MALFPQPMPSLRDPLPPKVIAGRQNNFNMNTSTSIDNSINSANSNYRNNSSSYAHGKFRSTDKRLLRSSVFLNYADSGDWIDRLTGMYGTSDGVGTDNSYYAGTNNDSSSNQSAVFEESFLRRQASDDTRGSRQRRSKSAPPRSSSSRSSVASLLVTPMPAGIADNRGDASLATYIAGKHTPSEPKSLRQFIAPAGAEPPRSSQGRSLRRQYNQKSLSACPYAVEANSFTSESGLR